LRPRQESNLRPFT